MYSKRSDQQCKGKVLNEVEAWIVKEHVERREQKNDDEETDEQHV